VEEIIKYRDNVWGDIEYNKLISALIDTPEFQRLDGIKQLGFADYVYRGAKHTRFSHSVGVYWIARRICREIPQNHKKLKIPTPTKELSDRFLPIRTDDQTLDNLNEYDEFEIKMGTIREIIETAAILHDIAHVPYGHSLEDEFTEYKKHDALDSLRLWYILYNERSNIRKVILNNGERWIPSFSNEELVDLLFIILKYKHKIEYEEEKIELFSEILDKKLKEYKNRTDKYNKLIYKMLKDIKKKYNDFTGKNIFHPFMADIIGNTICADILDYIPRDLKNTGLKVGVYDERIFKYFILGKDASVGASGALHLGIAIYGKRKEEKQDIINAILKIMSIRQSLAQVVYYHKTKAAATCMLTKIMEECKPPDTNPYIDSNSILNFTEEKLLDFLEENCEKEENKELLERLRNRQLNKVGAVIPYTLAKEFGNIEKVFIDKYHASEEHRNEIEGKVKVSNGVIVYCPPAHPQAKEVGTFIQKEANKAWLVPLAHNFRGMEIGDEIELISRDKYVRLWKFFLFIHPDDAKNPIILNRIIDKFCEEIEKIVKIKNKDELLNDKKFVTHPLFQRLEDLEMVLLEEWKEIWEEEGTKEIEKGQITPADGSGNVFFTRYEIFDKMKEEINKNNWWEDYRKDPPLTNVDYFDLFARLWLRFCKEYVEPQTIPNIDIGKVDEYDNPKEFRRILVQEQRILKRGGNKSGAEKFQEALRNAVMKIGS